MPPLTVNEPTNGNGEGDNLPPPMDTFINDLTDPTGEDEPPPVEITESEEVNSLPPSRTLTDTNQSEGLQDDAFSFATLDLQSHETRDTSARPHLATELSFPQIQRAAVETLKFIVVNGQELV